MPPAAAIAGAAIVGAGASVYASSKAAKAQKKAAELASQTQTDTFNKQVELQAPFRAGGLAGESRLLELLGLTPANDSGLNVNPNSPDFGKYAHDFSMNDFEQDPGYAFRVKEGMKALNNSMAARGLGMSGANVKGAINYGQEAGSQEYQNAFNRYQINRSNQLNPLQSLTGAAQSSANVLGSAAQNMGNNISQNQLEAGNARASGYVGGANALTSAISGGFNAYTGLQSANSLNTFLNGSGGGGGFTAPSNAGAASYLGNYFANNPTTIGN